MRNNFVDIIQTIKYYCTKVEITFLKNYSKYTKYSQNFDKISARVLYKPDIIFKIILIFFGLNKER